MPNTQPTPEFISCLRVLVGLYSEFKLTPQVIESYWIILADVDPDLLKAATQQIAANPDTNFFPRAGALRTAAFALVETASGVPSVDESWCEVLAAIGKYGRARKPEFTTELTFRALGEMRGWQALCNSDPADVGIYRAHFTKAYNQLLGRARTDVRMLPQVRTIVARFAGTGPALAAGPTAKRITKGDER
ncbi:MAG TPA: hypothetical protein VM537_15035 [Anaerolineae bacterium]|nr:hypothetical protein [Anaerolineae bacterium]